MSFIPQPNIVEEEHRQTFYPVTTGNLTDSNTPAAEREFLGVTTRRLLVDLTGTRQARIEVQVGNAVGGSVKFGIQYSLDLGTTWFFLSGVASGGSQGANDMVAIGTIGTKAGGWVTLPDAAKVINVVLRPVTKDGDGVVDPNIILSGIEVR